MKILGIIPARGGSKRLPRKNLADLNGHPLLYWTIDAAVKSGVFEDGWLWVSSEDEEIGQVAGQYWWRRDPQLAHDTTPTLDVVLDIFNHQPADLVIVLQPTSPLRKYYDITKALEVFNKTNADTVISVTENESDMVFERGWAGRLRPMSRTVRPNGAIYIARNTVLEQNLSWYDGFVYEYLMPKERSIDIDTEQDLEIARFLIKNGLDNI